MTGTMTGSARLVAVPEVCSLASLPFRDFRHACAVDLPDAAPHNAEYWAWRVFQDPPHAVRRLMRGRDAVGRRLGLQPVPASRDATAPFPVLSTGPDEVVLGVDDVHIDFRTAVLVVARDRGRAQLVCATVVRAHSAWGRTYLAGVRLVHPRLVRTLVNRAVRIPISRTPPTSQHSREDAR